MNIDDLVPEQPKQPTGDQSDWPPFGSLVNMTEAEKLVYNAACDYQINLLLREVGVAPLPATFDGEVGTYSDPQCGPCPWHSPFNRQTNKEV